ncbi:hypothetical protein [Clostridium tyrobutyricum]|uniref:hypothetical protein n=1 Tax=Clostridium tyrobutyricum TaxID=1519 RepID=UPI000312DD5F|nr:hypothetical protein [Clostridium tyrobutyricum]
MAEYTLAQMIEKLGRNPNLQFRFVNDEDYYKSLGIIVHLREDGYLANSSNETLTFSLRDKFTLVNEPVDRMTAFKAFEKGKSICCIYSDIKRTFIPINNTFTGFSIEEILYGKWFIEEGEK